MLKKFLEAGKIVGTHGVRGMVRIEPWSDSCEFLNGFKAFYLKSDGSEQIKIRNIRPHGRVAIATVDGVDTVELAEGLRGKIIYINREDAKLKDGRYFIEELIGCEVFDADSGDKLGILSDVSATGANDVWHIKKGDKEYLVPAIAEVIVSVDVETEKIMLRPLKGIFDDEN